MFRLHFEMASSVVGILRANSVFGLFCNSYKAVNGEKNLEKLLEELYNGEHYIVFSNPLKVGTIEFLDYGIVESYHSMIHRENGSRQALYTVDNKQIMNFDVLVSTDLDIEKYLDVMKELGIGARKNVGNGAIKSISIKEEKREERKQRRIVSDFVPSKEMKKLVKADYYVRRGITYNGKVQQSIIVFKAGAEVETDKEVVGRIIKDEGTGTYFNGMGLVV